jgi:hypothetical protein
MLPLDLIWFRFWDDEMGATGFYSGSVALNLLVLWDCKAADSVKFLLTKASKNVFLLTGSFFTLSFLSAKFIWMVVFFWDALQTKEDDENDGCLLWGRNLELKELIDPIGLDFKCLHLGDRKSGSHFGVESALVIIESQVSLQSSKNSPDKESVQFLHVCSKKVLSDDLRAQPSPF